jgi:hypothetical protein
MKNAVTVLDAQKRRFGLQRRQGGVDDVQSATHSTVFASHTQARPRCRVLYFERVDTLNRTEVNSLSDYALFHNQHLLLVEMN